MKCVFFSPPIPERGFSLSLVNHDMSSEVCSRGRNTFVTQPSAAVFPLVREFYANAPECGDYKVLVRGCLVSYYSKTINDVLGLPVLDDLVFK